MTIMWMRPRIPKIWTTNKKKKTLPGDALLKTGDGMARTAKMKTKLTAATYAILERFLQLTSPDCFRTVLYM